MNDIWNKTLMLVYFERYILNIFLERICAKLGVQILFLENMMVLKSRNHSL